MSSRRGKNRAAWALAPQSRIGIEEEENLLLHRVWELSPHLSCLYGEVECCFIKLATRLVLVAEHVNR
jgi:hypothetical protein